MPWNDNTLYFMDGQLLNSATTANNSNVIDTQGSDNTATNAKSYGFGAGCPKYIVITNPTIFTNTTLTSFTVALRTSDTISGTALSGTITTLWTSGTITVATAGLNTTAGIGSLIGGTPFIVPVNGAKQYLDILVTTNAANTNETGSLTAYLTEEVQSLQVATYPPTGVIAN